MRHTNALLAHPVFQLLGWTLLHFVWQGALVALAYAGISLSLRRSTANLRYTVACVAMLLMLLLPVATFFRLNSTANSHAVSERARRAAPALEQPVRGDAGAAAESGAQ